MDKVTVVKGLGPNSVEIIGLVFPNFKSAFEYTREAFGVEPTEQGTEDGNRFASWLELNDILEDNEELSDKFFTSYYGGCGACWAICVLEIDLGVPLVEFDLD